MDRPHDDKYAQLAMRFHSAIGKKVGRFNKAPMLWTLADYLESHGKDKHEQHLIMLASKWVKALPVVKEE